VFNMCVTRVFQPFFRTLKGILICNSGKVCFTLV